METLGDIMNEIDKQNSTRDAARREALNRTSWEFLHGHITCPPIDQLAQQEWEMGLVESACENQCLVEPDGYCEHGDPSWMLVLGLI